MDGVNLFQRLLHHVCCQWRLLDHAAFLLFLLVLDVAQKLVEVDDTLLLSLGVVGEERTILFFCNR